MRSLRTLIFITRPNCITCAHGPFDVIGGFAVWTRGNLPDLARPVAGAFNLNTSSATGTSSALCHWCCSSRLRTKGHSHRDPGGRPLRFEVSLERTGLPVLPRDMFPDLYAATAT